MKPMMLQRQLPEAMTPFARVLACGAPHDVVALLTQAAPVIGGPAAMLRLLEIRSSERVAALDHLLGVLERRGVDVRRELVSRLDPSALVALAADEACDLVLCPAPNEARLDTAERTLIERCPCAVWFGNRRAKHPPRRIAAAVDVGGDDDTRLLAHAVLTAAGTVAEHVGGELHVAHAWLPFGVHLLRSRASRRELTAYIEASRRRAERTLNRLLDDLAMTAGIRPSQVHLLRGEVEAEVAQLVADRRFDLLVVGTRGRRTRLGGAILEPRARQLLRQSAFLCSTLVIGRPATP